MTSALRHGDKAWTPARRLPGKRHYGIWDEEHRSFIHNTHPGGVQYASPERFVNGRVFIEKRAAPGFEHEVVRRARTLLGRSYDLVLFNCEHFVNYAAHGVAKSPQLQGALGMALFGWLLSTLGGPEYDPAVDRYRDGRGRFARG